MAYKITSFQLMSVVVEFRFRRSSINATKDLKNEFFVIKRVEIFYYPLVDWLGYGGLFRGQELHCYDMVEPNDYKNPVFENIDFAVIYYCSTSEQLNQFFFSFAMKLLTIQTIIISLHLLISSFTEVEKVMLFVISEM